MGLKVTAKSQVRPADITPGGSKLKRNRTTADKDLHVKPFVIREHNLLKVRSLLFYQMNFFKQLFGSLRLAPVRFSNHIPANSHALYASLTPVD